MNECHESLMDFSTHEAGPWPHSFGKGGGSNMSSAYVSKSKHILLDQVFHLTDIMFCNLCAQKLNVNVHTAVHDSPYRYGNLRVI